MINKELIEKAANTYTVNNYGVPKITCTTELFDNAEEDFIAGALWALKEVENVAIEFLDSIREYERENGNRICFDERDSKELFEIFLKERNNDS